jgi:ribosomal protein S24E
MKIEIESKKENPFLKRTELKVNIDHTSNSTPSKAALQQILSKELNKDPEYIEVRNIFSVHGIAASTSQVFVWQDKRVPNLMETKEQKPEEKPKEETKTVEKAEKKEEKPEEKAAPEKPKEDKPKEAEKQGEENPKEEKPAKA